MFRPLENGETIRDEYLLATDAPRFIHWASAAFSAVPPNRESCRLSLPADFDLKERVRNAVDIVDVIGSTLPLQPQGRNFVTRCPWHDDRRPSMTVNQERQTWKCWPCDIGGDVFSFIMRRDGVDFPTALRSLAEQAGIPIEEYRRGKKTKPGDPDDKETLFAAMKLVADEYFRILESDHSDDAVAARDYLDERGIDDESRKRFRIGFAPDEWSFAVDLLAKAGFNGEVALAAGIASAKRSGQGHVDMFRGRLMFPIHDLQDRAIALGGRLIPEIAKRHGDNAGGKYINGRETLLFRKSHQLYGLQLAREAIRREEEALVMEGYTDVVAARQSGIQPVVAVLGTALGEQHVRILKRFAGRVVLVLDGDQAGQSRADEVLELFVRASVDLRVLTLPDGADPADYVSEHGADALRNLVRKAPDALDHKLARLTTGIDLRRDTHAVTTAIDTMLGIVAKAPQGDGLRVDQLLMRMSDTFGFPAERLERRLVQLRKTSREAESRRRKIRHRRPNVPTASVQVPNAMLAQSIDDDALGMGADESTPRIDSPRPLEGIDRELFETLIEAPELAGMAVEAIDPDWLESNTAKMLLSAYQDLELEGRQLDLDTVLLLLENEFLKNQLVSCERRVQSREGKVDRSPEDQYAAIITRYRERETKADAIRKIQQLESTVLRDEEEDALLRELFEAEKTRHHQVRTD